MMGGNQRGNAGKHHVDLFDGGPRRRADGPGASRCGRDGPFASSADRVRGVACGTRASHRSAAEERTRGGTVPPADCGGLVGQQTRLARFLLHPWQRGDGCRGQTARSSIASQHAGGGHVLSRRSRLRLFPMGPEQWVRGVLHTWSRGSRASEHARAPHYKQNLTRQSSSRAWGKVGGFARQIRACAAKNPMASRPFPHLRACCLRYGQTVERCGDTCARGCARPLGALRGLPPRPRLGLRRLVTGLAHVGPEGRAVPRERREAGRATGARTRSGRRLRRPREAPR